MWTACTRWTKSTTITRHKKQKPVHLLLLISSSHAVHFVKFELNYLASFKRKFTIERSFLIFPSTKILDYLLHKNTSKYILTKLFSITSFVKKIFIGYKARTSLIVLSRDWHNIFEYIIPFWVIVIFLAVIFVIQSSRQYSVKSEDWIGK